MNEIIPDIMTKRTRHVMRLITEAAQSTATHNAAQLSLSSRRNRQVLSVLSAFIFVEAQAFWDYAHDDPKLFKRDYDNASNCI